MPRIKANPEEIEPVIAGDGVSGRSHSAAHASDALRSSLWSARPWLVSLVALTLPVHLDRGSLLGSLLQRGCSRQAGLEIGPSLHRVAGPRRPARVAAIPGPLAMVPQRTTRVALLVKLRRFACSSRLGEHARLEMLLLKPLVG